ncbi:FxSxx-COOH system tetratricopeptide repeat protein [Longispora urticae]
MFHGPVTVHAGTPGIRWPVRVGVVPAAANGFQDRAIEVLTEGTTWVLSGLGGVGKTQWAVGYARRRWADRDVDLLLWVNAASRPQVLSAYATAARVVLRASEDVEEAAERFLAWLAGTERRWLVVLDDVRSPGDLAGLWPPDGPGATTVVTTRRRDSAMAGPGRRPLGIGVFSPAEAVAYLSGVLGPRQGSAAALAADVGHLPLALAQAAAYMADRGLGYSEFRDRLARGGVAQVVPESEALPDGYTETVAGTWALSVAAADALRPVGLARRALELAAVLDPGGIPLTVFGQRAALRHVGGDADAVRDALRNAHRLSLLDHDADAGLIRVHALVQRVTRDALPAARLAEVARAAADALLEAWPAPEPDPEASQVLRDNVAAVRAVTGAALFDPGLHPVLPRAGVSLGRGGQFTAAAAFCAELSEAAADRLGPRHPDVLLARREVAYWRGEAGDPAGAVTELEQVLTDMSDVLGPDDARTLKTRDQLGYCRGCAGDTAGAVADFAALLPARSRVLGPEHPDTLTTRDNLADWRGEAGEPAAAAAALTSVLADRVRVLGPEHPDTLTTRNNLGRWLGRSGDPAGAVRVFAELLDVAVRVFGPRHPDTLTTRNNLANWRGHAGDASGAADAFAALLDDRRRILGPDHPDTLSAWSGLARWRGEAGDAAYAVGGLRRVLVERLRVLGADHPHTLVTRQDLAVWLGRSGAADRAVEELTRLLPDQIRVLGPGHPQVRATELELERWRQE